MIEIAKAKIDGGSIQPEICGEICFKQIRDGVLITVQICNLPHSNIGCNSRIFGFHIHEGNSCTGDSEDEFKNALTHYNPQKCEHPQHAGDMPPLFENNGYAYLSFFTNRFEVKDVIGKVVIIHDMPDDFNTNPSGNSGTKIACGKIEVC